MTTRAPRAAVRADPDPRLLGVVRVGIYATLLLSPLPFGGVTRAGVTAIEVAAGILALLTLAALRRGGGISARFRSASLPFAGVLLLGTLQVVPWPAAWTETLSPTLAGLRRTVGAAVDAPAVAGAAITYSLPDTFDALSRWVAYGLLAFCASVALRTRAHFRALTGVVCAAAAFQALYGATEYLSGNHGIFGYAKRHYLDSATGTFINRNHFASYLAMALPLPVAQWLIVPPSRATGGLRRRLVGLGRAEGLWTVSLFIAATAIVAGVFLSYSRGGLIAALVGCLALAANRLAHRRRLAWVAAVFLLPALLLSWQQLRPPGDRFVRPAEEYETVHGRTPVWRAAASMTRDTPLLGTGFGTFEDAFRLYQPLEIRLRFDHAHNDWLQAWVEGGPLAPLLLLALGGILLFRDDPGIEVTADSARITGGAAAALVAVAFHSLFDFPLKIPAVAVLAAVLAGVLAGGHAPPWRSRRRWRVGVFPSRST